MKRATTAMTQNRKAMICAINFVIPALGLLLLASPAAFGQKWEVGAGGGGSFYNARTLAAPMGSGEAKFKPGFAATGWIGQMGDRIGGDFRYTIAWNDMELKGPGGSFSMGGRTQAIHYDLLFYTGSRKSKTRGYVLVGGGMKQFAGTGQDVAFQPTNSFAVLTRTSEWKPLVTVGAGLRMSLSKRSHLRAEVRGYFTPAPTEVITQIGGDFSGWYFDIVPMVSLSYVWD
jgi:hypothetical protein